MSCYEISFATSPDEERVAALAHAARWRDVLYRDYDDCRRREEDGHGRCFFRALPGDMFRATHDGGSRLCMNRAACTDKYCGLGGTCPCSRLTHAQLAQLVSDWLSAHGNDALVWNYTDVIECATTGKHRRHHNGCVVVDDNVQPHDVGVADVIVSDYCRSAHATTTSQRPCLHQITFLYDDGRPPFHAVRNAVFARIALVHARRSVPQHIETMYQMSVV